MRMLLFFDLPTISSENLKAYRNFVKNLKKEGFYMIQESVYVKMVLNNAAAESVKSKINGFLPPEGNIMILVITEKQFSNMSILLGEATTDIINNVDRIITL